MHTKFGNGGIMVGSLKGKNNDSCLNKNSFFSIESQYLVSNWKKFLNGKMSFVFSMYLNDVYKFSSPDIEEINHLAKNYYETRNPELRKKLINMNLRLVLKISAIVCRKFPTIDFDDVVQEGNKGLIYAIDRYSPEKNASFGYYAVFWIKSNIFRYALANLKVIKLVRPKAAKYKYGRYLKAKEAVLSAVRDSDLCEVSDFDTVLIRELSNILDLSEKDVKKLLAYESLVKSDFLSIEDAVFPESDIFIKDTIVSCSPGPEQKLIEGEVRSKVRKLFFEFVSKLKDRDRFVFLQRFNFFDKDFSPKTLEELGKILGVTRERVRQIEERLVNNFKQYLAKNGINGDSLDFKK